MKSLGPVPAPPPLGGIPPSGYASALHQSYADTAALLNAYNIYFQGFVETTILDAEGRKLTILARRLGTGAASATDSTKWFAVSDTSTEDVFRVRVNEGRILAPDTAGIEGDPPSVGALAKEYPVEGVELEVADGTFIYLRISTTQADHEHEYESQPDDDAVVALTSRVTHKERVFSGTSAVVVTHAGEASSSSSQSFVLLAEISITDGVMRIIPRHEGLVTVPTLSVSYGAPPVITGDFNESQFEVCDSGTPKSVTFLTTGVD